MNLSEIINSNPLVLLSFGTDWCAPCKSVQPIVDEVIQNFSGKVSLYKINTDEQHDITRENNVFSVPTLLLIKNGKEVWRMNGLDSVQNLKKVLEKHVR